jgi:hypothetical protein
MMMNTATTIQTTVEMTGGAPAAPTIHETTTPMISATAQATSTPTHPLLAMFILYLRVDAGKDASLVSRSFGF